ncbi:MAG: 6-bladed beta-propeller [Gemmatimonadales bacterium]|nr:6-bladed beta-propeller [Gemmatimonadales bacterium]
MFRLTFPLLSIALIVACGCDGINATSDPAGLATIIDSTADTIFAQTDGDVAPSTLRTLVSTLSIAPGPEDTLLFSEIRELAVDDQRRMWVYDPRLKQLFLFSPTGTLVKRIGRGGSGPGEFARSSGMVVYGGNGVALWDSQNSRISFIDGNGSYTHSWPTPGGFSTTAGLVTDLTGTLFIKRPVTPPRDGEILGRMGLVRLKEGGAFADSSVAPDLRVPREPYVARTKDAQSSTSARYAASYHWAWHPEGYFLAADGGKYEIVLARKHAKPVVIRRTSSPVPVTDEEREVERAEITYQLRTTDPGWLWSGPALPIEKAPVMGLRVARDGRIWVRVAQASEVIPLAERSVSEDSLAPVRRHRTPAVYEVFEPSGRFLGRVAFPPRAGFGQAVGDEVWAVVLGSDDMPAVTRFKVTPGFR